MGSAGHECSRCADGCKWRTVEQGMLEISLSVEGVSVVVPKGTHTAVVGPPGCGASTLLRVIAGDLRPKAGEVRIGARVVDDLPRRRRPLLYVTSDLEAPGRWSVQHLLVAAVR